MSASENGPIWDELAMALHAPTLRFIPVAGLAFSATVMTLFGIAQRVHRGFWWWAVAQWLVTLGLLLCTIHGSALEILPLAGLLLLQWPVVTLVGLRRF
jgi:hypothetical protein